jgi:hypothetical protein
LALTRPWAVPHKLTESHFVVVIRKSIESDRYIFS